MTESITRITLDVQETSASKFVTIKQGDSGSRKIVIHLTDQEEPYEIPGNCYAVFTGTKPDGNVLFNHCDIVDNTIVYTVTEQTSAAAGRIPCEIKLYGPEDARITSAVFQIIVEGTVYADGKVESEPEFSALTHLISEASEVIAAGEEAVGQWNRTLQTTQQAIQETKSAADGAFLAAGNANDSAEAANTSANAANQAAGNAETEAGNAAQAAASAHAAAEGANTAAKEAADARISLTEAANAAVDEIRKVSTNGVDAPAIVCTARGEAVRLKDSADRHFRGLKVFGKTEQRTTTGKNLLQNTAITQTFNGVTFTVNKDGSITANGTATGNAEICIQSPFVCEEDMILSGCTGGSSGTYRLQYYDPANSSFAVNCYDGDTLITGGKNGAIRIYIANGTTVSNRTFYPMVRLASETDSTYEPYTGGQPSPSPEYPQELASVGDVTVTVCGKNLVDVGGLVGITCPTSYTTENVNFYPGTFAASITSINGTQNGFTMNLGNDNGTVKSIPVPGTAVFTLTQEEANAITRAAIYPYAGTVGGIITSLMVNEGTAPETEYEPYKEPQTLSVCAPNGLPGIPVSSGGNYTDSTGQQWICDEVYFEKGVYVQRIVQKRMQNLILYGINKNGLSIGYVAELRDKVNIDTGMCNALPLYDKNNQFTSENSCYAVSGYGALIQIAGCATINDLNAYLAEHEVIVQVALKEPIETALSTEELAQYAALHTNYPNTTVYNDAGAYMEAKYVADTKLYIDNKFNELAAALVDKV